MKNKGMRIGILTAGGDCPGLNAAIRGVGKSAIVQYGMEVVGICSGFRGLIDREYVTLTENLLSGILTEGGTILRTSREKPFKNDNGTLDKVQTIKENYKELGLDCLICLGGNGTMKTAYQLHKEGLNIIGVPKTIDNDVWGTDVSFGFYSAVNIATEAIDRIHTTANSHKRIMVIEVMGHHAGWLALYSGVSGGGDVILIPEIPYTMESICSVLTKRYDERKPYSIVVVAEGIDTPKPKKSKGHYIAKKIMEYTGLETRETILGYIQRGGSPSPMDRVISTRLGAHAAELARSGKFGFMTSLRDTDTVAVPLKEVAGKIKTVQKDDPLVKEARLLGTSFGD